MQISLVVPVFNEADAIPELCKEINALFSGFAAGSCECVIVDDGSTDGSLDLLADMRGRYNFIKIISQARLGKAEALKAGWNASAGEWLLCMDGDLQDDCSNFPRMIACMQEQHYDMVVGWRKQRRDSLKKCMASMAYNIILNLCFGMHLHDHNCGLKIMRRDVFRSLKFRGTGCQRYLTVLAKQAGYRVGECVVSHRPRPYGKSKYGVGRMMDFAKDLVVLLLRR